MNINLIHICRVRIAISCRMNFDDYPLDEHTCQFQVGSCKLLLRSSRELKTEKYFSDYDTNETVTCQSFFLYDEERQRSLQHYIQIANLPTSYKRVILPSGSKISQPKPKQSNPSNMLLLNMSHLTGFRESTF